ncbi:MAG: neutral/alkaline non-lysosomal ceramidase N-terminal domain-containing protein [Armatimonadota bacterium]
MRAGFGKTDITPRVGVELCGFGPFLQRRSVGIRDRLWAKAVAIEHSGSTVVIVSCDLIGLALQTIPQIRELVHEATGLSTESVMVHCTHTHSGPCTALYTGWGERDNPYNEILPGRIADACIQALGNLTPASISHAEVPCEGIGLNREYDHDSLPLEDVLREDWRPAKPELTDTKCHVLTIHNTDGQMLGFMSYFGCHPVVCCEVTRYINGDFVGVATNMLERETPGSIGLFLQGAQGDVNSCVVHKPEKEALLALDVIAARYARAVRQGLCDAKPIKVDALKSSHRMVNFTRKNLSIGDLRQALDPEEVVINTPGASDDSSEVRMAVVKAVAIRKRIAMMEAGVPTSQPVELHGIRLGPISLLCSPLEIFQAIKNEVIAKATSVVPLVVGISNGDIGYAPDRVTAAKGGYAADMVPIIVGEFPFQDIHTELVQELLDLEKELLG